LDQLLVGPEKAQKAQIICLAIYGALKAPTFEEISAAERMIEPKK